MRQSIQVTIWDKCGLWLTQLHITGRVFRCTGIRTEKFTNVVATLSGL